MTKKTDMPVQCGPGVCDFAMEIIVDRDTGYLADGHDHLYFQTHAVPDSDDWHEIAEDYADGGELVEYKVKAVSWGRHWEADDTTVTWSATGN